MRRRCTSKAIGGLVIACLFTTPFADLSFAQSGTVTAQVDEHVPLSTRAASMVTRQDLTRARAQQTTAATGAKKGSSKVKWILIAAGGGAAAFVVAKAAGGGEETTTPTITIGTPAVGAP